MVPILLAALLATQTGAGAKPRGMIARLRHIAGPRLPRFLRPVGARVLHAIEERRGARYEIAGQQLRFLKGSAPPVAVAHADARTNVDALQLTSFANAIHPGDVVADVGSYRGTYAVVAAACAGSQGRVYAFEPTTANRAIITNNVRLNGFDNRVTIEAAAVSDQTGTSSFYAWGDATTNSLAAIEAQAAATAVRTVALDDYFVGHTLPRVLKIDIEGAELLALRGAQKILASDAVILCELHPYAWSDLGYGGADLIALLERYNRAPIDVATGAIVTDFQYGAVWLAKRD